MPIEIRHRDTGAVLHTVNADTLRGADLSRTDLTGADLTEADLRGAYLTKTDLTGAYLDGADLRGAYLSGANLSEAYLDGADLSGANLRGANLRGANLYGAELRGANLYGANLNEAIINEDKLSHLLARATRSDGFEFFLFALQGGSPKIKASCRWMTLAEYRAHVAEQYPDTDKARETLDILNYFEARAR